MVCFPRCFLVTNFQFAEEAFSFYLTYVPMHLLDTIFAAVIYPWLRQLGDELIIELESNKKGQCTEILSRKRVEDRKMVSDKDLEKDNECGICMENCTKMVLPNCGHALCISCFHDWYPLGSLFCAVHVVLLDYS